MHAVRKVEKNCGTDSQLKERIHGLMDKLRNRNVTISH
jgi:hypothetical protein